MTQTAAICQALLEGKILSIMTAFKMFGCTNLPREVSRGIEQKFHVHISRVRRDFVSQYGKTNGFYYEYRLNRSMEQNKDGIAKMKEYVKEQLGNQPPRTEKEKTVYEQTQLFLNQ